MTIWRPKDPRARALIKLGLWAGMLTWMVFTVALGMVLALSIQTLYPATFGQTAWQHFLGAWVIPVWIIYTSLMLVWVVARFVTKTLRSKES